MLIFQEFEDIGAIISSFASDEAIVVMGTAIDANLEDQLRVTVVATGLGQPPAAISSAKEPIKIIKNNASTPSVTAGGLDYGSYDKSAIQRQKAVGDGLSGALDEEMLDIPAFLRRQAD